MTKHVSEFSQAKNLENFEQQIIVCTGFGANYNPSKTSLTLVSLGTKYTSADNALKAVNAIYPTLVNAVNDRELLFDPLRELCTRIMNAVSASEVTKEFIKDIKTVIRKLQGRRAKPRIIDDPNTPEDESLKSISASQLSFDNRINNLDILINLLSSNAGYAPNETNLTVASLTTLLNNMRVANTAAKTAYSAIKSARINRNKILYHPVSGLVTIAHEVNKYVLSVFGAKSSQYKELTALKFLNLGRRKY